MSPTMIYSLLWNLSPFHRLSGSVLTARNEVVLYKPRTRWACRDITSRGHRGRTLPVTHQPWRLHSYLKQRQAGLLSVTLMQKVWKRLKLSRNNFLTVLFGEKSPRFRQGKHGKKKKKRKNERKDQMFSKIPVLGIRYFNLTRIHVSVTELALTAHILFFTWESLEIFLITTWT